jgi:hypothetical protein
VPASRSSAANGMVSPQNLDARWLFDALKASPIRRDVKIARTTHLMHLEQNCYALYREAQTFLNGDHPADRPLS